MSISTQISRLQTDRNTIRAKLVELGMATGTDNLTRLASAIEGLVNQGAVAMEIKAGSSYTIPKGYHNGSGVISAVADVEGDAAKYELQAKSVTPSKKQQNITADAGKYYGLSSVTVAPIPDIYQDVSSVTATAGEVLTGKVFVPTDGTPVTGTMANNGAVNKQLDVATATYSIPQGYHNGEGKVTISLDTKTVTPTKSAQDITPEDGKVLSKVTVAAIPDKYIDTTESNAPAAAANILLNKVAFVNGSKVTGSMPNNGDTTANIDGITTTSVTIPAGYTTGGTVSLTGDIEEQLAAI